MENTGSDVSILISDSREAWKNQFLQFLEERTRTHLILWGVFNFLKIILSPQNPPVTDGLIKELRAVPELIRETTTCSVGLVDHGLDDPPPGVDEPEKED